MRQTRDRVITPLSAIDATRLHVVHRLYFLYEFVIIIICFSYNPVFFSSKYNRKLIIYHNTWLFNLRRIQKMSRNYTQHLSHSIPILRCIFYVNIISLNVTVKVYWTFVLLSNKGNLLIGE